ncbi:MAG: hypothetical protein JWO03_507 [Bacteroidetes bacterium]|nr:hypothetical protein [Bacteroidota bacterium]
MQLKQIIDKNKFKREFITYIRSLIGEDSRMDFFVGKMTEYRLENRGELYFVGGFVRDFINDKPSRDIDVISNVSAEEIQKLINILHIPHKRNRHNGFKLLFDEMEMDIWSLSDNWAFRKNLVTSDPNETRSISRGAFYNFDSPVFAYTSKKLSVEYYNKCIKSKILDIQQANIEYKKYNPTREANILRAFYLHEKYDLAFSPNVNQYIYDHISAFDSNYDGAVNRLYSFLELYPKYSSVLDKTIIKDNCNEIEDWQFKTFREKREKKKQSSSKST